MRLTHGALAAGILAIATAGTFTRGCEPTPPAPPAGPLQPYLVAVSVPNLEESLQWYRDRLGFMVLQDTTFPAHRLRLALLDRDGLQLELVQLEGSHAPDALVPGLDNPAQIQGFGKIAFRVHDAAAWASALAAAGVEFQVPLRRSSVVGGYTFVVRDNAGNWLQFSDRRR